MATVTVRKSYDVMQREYAELIQHLASNAWQAYCQNPYRSLFLYGRQGTRPNMPSPIWSSLWIGDEDDSTPGGKIVRPEVLPRGATLGVMEDRIRGWLYKEPLYIFAD